MTFRRLHAMAAAVALMFAIPVAEAGAAKRTFGARALQEGMRGRDVRVLQDFLTRVGLRTAVDGQYGPGTARRVRSFERRASLRVDGRVSLEDAAALRARVESGAAPAPQPEAAPVAHSQPSTATERATIGADGLAVAPASAPEAVKAIIAAANEIHAAPYKYGGGHGRWTDSGYDCSGSVSYALHGAGLLNQALDSSGFTSWGDAGEGRWVTVYGHGGHAYMVVAGLRFDTSGRKERNSRWSTDPRTGAGFTARHPAGL